MKFLSNAHGFNGLMILLYSILNGVWDIYIYAYIAMIHLFCTYFILIILFCIILYYIFLYYVILYYIMVYFIILYCIILNIYYIIFYYIILNYFTILYETTLYYDYLLYINDMYAYLHIYMYRYVCIIYTNLCYCNTHILFLAMRIPNSIFGTCRYGCSRAPFGSFVCCSF